MSFYAEDMTAAEWLSRGDDAMNFCLYDNAAECYDKYLSAISQDPETSDAQRAQGAEKLVSAMIAGGKLDAAAELLNETYASFNDVSLEFLRAKLAFEQKDFDKALEKAESVAAVAGEALKPQVMILKSDALMRQGRVYEAIDILSQIWHDKEELTNCRYDVGERLASAYLALEKFDEANNFASAILKDVPAPRQVAYTMLQIQICAGLNDSPTLQNLWLKLEGHRPPYPDEAWWQMLWIVSSRMHAVGKFELAMQFLPDAMAMASNPEDMAACLMLLGSCNENLRKTDEAESAYSRICKDYASSSKYVPALLARAELKLKLKDVSGAVALFEEVLNAQSATATDRSNAGNQAGTALQQEGRNADAVKFFVIAAKYGTTPVESIRSQIFAADNAAKSGNPAFSVALLRSIVAKYPSEVKNADACFLLGDLLVDSMSDVAGAIAAYKQGLALNSAHASAERVKLRIAVLEEKLAQSPEERRNAVAALQKLAAECQTAEIAISAYFEGCRAAEALGDIEWSARILDEMLKRFPDREETGRGWYNCIALKLRLSKEEDAVTTADAFLSANPESAVLPDICLLLGDYFSLGHDFASASKYYQRILQMSRISMETEATALFESATCANNLKQYSEALGFLDRLLDKAKTEGSMPSQKLGEAWMLYGDIKSQLDDFEAAGNAFGRVVEIVGDSALGYIALGRQAEMLMAASKPGDNASVKKAQDMLDKIVAKRKSLPPEVVELALFRKAKCLEIQEQNDDALECYTTIILDYSGRRKGGKVPPWRYYAESVFEAGRLLKAKGSVDDLRCAAMFYDDLARANLPRSDEAAEQAAEIRRNYNIGI